MHLTPKSWAMRLATCSASSACRLVSSTRAPADARPAAIASPRPLLPPVTIALLPVKSNWRMPGNFVLLFIGDILAADLIGGLNPLLLSSSCSSQVLLQRNLYTLPRGRVGREAAGEGFSPRSQAGAWERVLNPQPSGEDRRMNGRSSSPDGCGLNMASHAVAEFRHGRRHRLASLDKFRNGLLIFRLHIIQHNPFGSHIILCHIRDIGGNLQRDLRHAIRITVQQLPCRDRQASNPHGQPDMQNMAIRVGTDRRTRKHRVANAPKPEADHDLRRW